MKRSTELKLLFLCGVAIVLFVIGTACGEQGTVSPTTSSPLVEPVPPSGGSGGTTPTVSPPAPPTPTGCNVVQLDRSSIAEETHCEKGVRFYAGANVTQGTGYFNVHIGGLNSGGPILGPNELNKWSKWYDLEEGSYTYTLAAETKIDGKVYQCDHHNHTFTIPVCRVIPPECPSEAFFNITTNKLDPKRVGECPDSESYAYKVSTNLPVVEMILPPGCTATSPTTGTCTFDIEKCETKQMSISGRGFIMNVEQQIQCGSDFETMIVGACCDACLDAELSITPTHDPDMLTIGDPPEGMWYTVGGGKPQHSANTFAIGAACDSSITVRVVLNSDRCACDSALWQECEHWDFVFEGEESCAIAPLPEPVAKEGNMLRVFAPPAGYYTVGGDATKHTTEKTFGPFAEDCDSEITIRVNFYDDVCEVLCHYTDVTFKGPDYCVDSSESLMCKFNAFTHKVVCKAHVSHAGRIVMKQNGENILVEQFTGDSAFFSDEIQCGSDPVAVSLTNKDKTTCEDPVRCGVVKTTVEIPECPCEVPAQQCIRHMGRIQCSDFGLVTLYKNDTGGDTECTIAEMNADAAIVKGGIFYHFIPASSWPDLCTCHTNPDRHPSWSHVEYCGCPQEW